MPGPDTPPPPSRIEALIERQLEAMASAIEDCFTRARDMTPRHDHFGYDRRAEVDLAAKIAEHSAHLVAAVAKVRGRFDHRIHVERDKRGDR